MTESRTRTGSSRWFLKTILVLLVGSYVGLWVWWEENPVFVIKNEVSNWIYGNPNSQFTAIDSKVDTAEEAYLQKLMQAMDIENESTRIFTLNVAAKYPGDYNISQICSVYDELFSNWKYVNDPRGQEYIAKASTTIKAELKGDCDDFAILMATMIESIGGKTRIVAAYGEEGNHAYAEVFMGPRDKMEGYLETINDHYSDYFKRRHGVQKVSEIHYHVDQDGNAWMNLDWTSEYPGGSYFEADHLVIYYPREGLYSVH